MYYLIIILKPIVAQLAEHPTVEFVVIGLSQVQILAIGIFIFIFIFI
jgi:hypothetical protein